MSKQGEVVCVTGGSGCIGSWLVRLLLHRDYTVHATVKDLKDDGETKHLEALVEGAESRLRLFQIDLLDYNSILAAVNGCSGVFHLASPCIVDQVHDPEKELLDPAIKGTLNVLTAAKQAGVSRVVLTSSISAITPSPSWPSDKIKGEDCWTDIDYCKQKGLWYPLSKTLAEKAAWEFAKEKGLDVVVVNPGTVMGPVISPRLNASMLMLLRILEGCTETYENFFMGSVHFKDVALAHILVYENKSATGRHLCLEAISRYGDFVAKVAELYPEYKVHSYVMERYYKKQCLNPSPNIPDSPPLPSNIPGSPPPPSSIPSSAQQSEITELDDQDIVNAMALVEVCKQRLQSLRDDDFGDLLHDVEKFCEEHDIVIPNMEDLHFVPGKSRRKAPKITNFHYYRVDLYFQVLDMQLKKLNDRFNEFAKGHPTGLAEGKERSEEANELGFRIHSHGSNYQGRCGEPKEQGIYFINKTAGI